MRALFGGAPNNSAPTVGHSPQTPPADPSPAFPLLHGANTAQQPPWWEEVHGKPAAVLPPPPACDSLSTACPVALPGAAAQLATHARHPFHDPAAAQDGEWATLSRSNSAKRRLFGQLGGGDSADEPNGSWAPLSARAARPSTSQIVLAALAGVALLALLSLSPMGGHASAGGIVHGSGGRRYLQAGAPLVAAAAAPAAAGARAAGMAQLREPLWNVSMLLTAGREQAAQLAGEAQQPFLRALVRGASAASGEEGDG